MQRTCIRPSYGTPREQVLQYLHINSWSSSERARSAESTNGDVFPGHSRWTQLIHPSLDKTSTLVAVKIVNIDDMDFSADPRERDETVKDFRKEVGILQQLKDSGARNVNLIHEAFDLHSQLWIISDYCTGGSVRTLMRANPTPKLEEHFLIPVARELAVAMKCVHDIGVIHRDIKCTNVYVTEDGQIQLGDFGIVGVMDDGASKRTTIIGTPWYMPREMHIDAHSVAQGYGTEVDIWSYGCTVYEMATGQVPNAGVSMEFLNSVLENAPRLKGDEYSEGLRDFVAFCLNNDPKARPTSEQILQHPYIADTERTHPTNSLVALIERYTIWEFKGGQRTSLFNPGGAAAPVGADDTGSEPGDDNEDWNFSTSASFNQEFGRRYSHMMLNGLEGLSHDAPAGAGSSSVGNKNLTVFEQIQKEHKEKSATRGEMSLDRLFNPESVPYAMHAPPTLAPQSPPEPISDLPLRNISEGNAMRESTVMIDLDASPGYSAGPNFNFDFDDVPTLKAKTRRSYSDDDDDEQPEEEEDDYQYGQFNDDKRATKDWKFPGTSTATTTAATMPKRATMDWSFATAQPAEADEADATMNLPPPGDGGETATGFRPQLMHTSTVPLGQFGDYLHTNQQTATTPSNNSFSRDSINSMIDLDLGFSDPADLPPRPSTASSASGSTGTERTSGDPFDLEEDSEQLDVDRNRLSYHKQWQSDGGPADSNRGSLRNVPMHARGSSLSSSASELERSVQVPAAAEDVFSYDFEENLRTATRKPLHHGLDISAPLTAPLSSQADWPDFNRDYTNNGSPEYGANSVPQLGDPSFPLSGHDHLNGTSPTVPRSLPISQSRDNNAVNGRSPSYSSGDRGAPRDTLKFPKATPPNPAAVDEDASVAALASELDRMLDDMRGAFKSTSRALRQRAGLDGEDPAAGGGGFGGDGAATFLSSSVEEETDAGFESASSFGFRSGVETGDEDGY